MVIELNIHKMSLPELTECVRGKCSEYGTVSNISVHLYPLGFGREQPFAVVQMSSPDETASLRNALGDGYFAGGVTVQLAHKA